MGNNDIFEFYETSKRQCLDCAAYWEIGIVYCTCGKCMQPWERNRQLNRDRFDSLSIPGYVIKKNQSRGARHGQSMRQVMYHKAREKLRKAKLPENGPCETVLEQWHTDADYQKPLSDEGWTTNQPTNVFVFVKLVLRTWKSQKKGQDQDLFICKDLTKTDTQRKGKSDFGATAWRALRKNAWSIVVKWHTNPFNVRTTTSKYWPMYVLSWKKCTCVGRIGRPAILWTVNAVAHTIWRTSRSTQQRGASSDGIACGHRSKWAESSRLAPEIVRTVLKGQKSEVVASGMSERHRLVTLGVYFRRWTWSNTTTTMARLRRKFGWRGRASRVEPLGHRTHQHLFCVFAIRSIVPCVCKHLKTKGTFSGEGLTKWWMEQSSVHLKSWLEACSQRECMSSRTQSSAWPRCLASSRVCASLTYQDSDLEICVSVVQDRKTLRNILQVRLSHQLPTVSGTNWGRLDTCPDLRTDGRPQRWGHQRRGEILRVDSDRQRASVHVPSRSRAREQSATHAEPGKPTGDDFGSWTEATRPMTRWMPVQSRRSTVFRRRNDRSGQLGLWWNLGATCISRKADAGLPMRACTGRFWRLRRAPLARSRGYTRRKNMVADGFQIHKVPPSQSWSLMCSCRCQWTRSTRKGEMNQGRGNSRSWCRYRVAAGTRHGQSLSTVYSCWSRAQGYWRHASRRRRSLFRAVPVSSPTSSSCEWTSDTVHGRRLCEDRDVS